MFQQPFMMVWDSINRSTADFEDFFNSDNWTNDGSGDFSISGGALHWETANTNANRYAYVDMLGTTVSDTAWVLRFKIVIENFAKGSDATNQELYIVLSDGATTAVSVSQDAIGMRFVVDNTLDTIKVLGREGNLNSGNLYDMTTAVSATTFYVEIIRTSSTTVTLELFSDSNYSTSIEASGSQTLSGTVTNLRYLRIQNRNNLDNTNDHTCDGYIDDVQFWDGVTSVP